jgi:flagellar basal-body rod protein FlgG
MGAIELAGAILSRASQRVEVAAQNMANMTTPGYKAKRSFLQMIDQTSLGPADAGFSDNRPELLTDFTDGKLRNTGAPFDLAISGSGFFAVRSGDITLYTRNGQFRRDSDGRLVTSSGMALQSSGGDLTVDAGNVTILPDGTVLNDGQPAAQVTVVDFSDPQVLKPAEGGAFSAPAGAAHDVTSTHIHQGMLEESNVSTASEMLSLMSAMRSAESGQHIVQALDDLLGQAVNAFGQV